MTISHQNCLGPDFLNGFATAAYQVEGGYLQDGRGLSVWDVALADKPNGNVACNSYNMMDEDVELLKTLGARVFRFSISWSRIIPKGGRNDPINEKGIAHYCQLIDKLLAAGIIPFVTLFHWDLPVELAERYGGFRTTDRREELFLDWDRYVHVCFESFGDRVKHWITHNEPIIFIYCHFGFEKDFDVEEKWNLGNNLLLTHARAVDIYRRLFQPSQQGTIGITLQSEWVEPIDNSQAARDAAKLGMDVSIGWFADPIFLGKPNANVSKIAPGAYNFTDAEWALLRGSSDFFGLNHYSTVMATGRMVVKPTPFDTLFGSIEKTAEPNGVPLGHRGHEGHPYDVPWGFYKLLMYIQQTWAREDVNVTGEPIPIYVTENGYAEQGELHYPVEKKIADTNRINYFKGYLAAMAQAVQEGVPVKGYMAWSLLDNLEWTMGYKPCFGVTYVDKEHDFKRMPKDSAFCVKKFFDEAIQK